MQLSLILHYLLVLCSDRERGWWFHIWPPEMFILLKILPCQWWSNFVNFNCCAVFMDVKYSVVLVAADALSPVGIRSLACIMATIQDLRIYPPCALPSCMSMYYVCQRYISGTVMAWSIFCRTCATVCELNPCQNSPLFFAMVEPKLCYMYIGPRYGNVWLCHGVKFIQTQQYRLSGWSYPEGRITVYTHLVCMVYVSYASVLSDQK